MLNPNTLTHHTYLGDGLYVGVERGDVVVLYSWNGIDVLAAVYLEPLVLESFMMWVLKLGKEEKNDRHSPDKTNP